MPTTPLPVHGIDVSKWQADLDFAVLKRNGLGFLVHKATQGLTYVDPMFTARAVVARKVGITFGAYHFADATSDPVLQAKRFLAIAKVQPGDLRPMLDVEDTTGSSFSKMTKVARTAWVGKFVAEVKRQLGVAPFLYTPFDLDDHFGCPLWAARYTNDNGAPHVPTPWTTYTLRQFSNGDFGVPKTFPGLKSKTDLNCWNGDPKRMQAAFTIPAAQPAPKPTPAPVPAPTPAPAPRPVLAVPIAFVGANMKGAQGGMAQPLVESDLQLVAAVGDVFGVQEFQNTWYWDAALKVLPGWESYPPMAEGNKSKTAAIFGGQAIFWRQDRFEKVGEYVTEAFDVKKPNLGTMADRWFRAALLRDRVTGFTAWYCSGHNVVGGDWPTSPAVNRDFLDQNLTRWDPFLAHLVATGYPVVGEIDANINRKSGASFDRLSAIFAKYGATLHGELGIEYAFTIDGTNGKTGPVTDSTIPDAWLNTDHEARVLTFTGSTTGGPL